MTRILILCAVISSSSPLFAQNDWTMISGNRERTSWVKNETSLKPPFSQRVVALPPPISTYSDINIDYIAKYGGVLYLAVEHDPNLLVALDPATGSSPWHAEIEGSGSAMGNCPVIINDLVIAGGQTGTAILTCFERLTGTVRWNRNVYSLYARSAVADGSRLYFLTDSLYCLDAGTGHSAWTVALGSSVSGSPVLDDQAVYYNYRDSLHARDKMTGAHVWTTAGATKEGITLDDQHVYVTATNAIRAIRKSDGTEAWRHTIRDGKNAAYIIGNALAIDDARLYYGVWQDKDGKGTLTALDKRNGGELWHHVYGGVGVSAATIANGYIYTTNWGTKSFWCLEAVTGNVVHSDVTRQFYDTQPVVAGGSVYTTAAPPGGTGFTIVVFTHNPSGLGHPKKPADFSMTNYPNPFSGRTTLVYSLRQGSHIRLELFDALGRRASVLAEGWKDIGTHEQTVAIPSACCSAGTYFLRLLTESGSTVHPLSLLR